MSELDGVFEVVVLVPVTFKVRAHDERQAVSTACAATLTVFDLSGPIVGHSVGFPEAIRVKEIEEVTG